MDAPKTIYVKSVWSHGLQLIASKSKPTTVDSYEYRLVEMCQWTEQHVSSADGIASYDVWFSSCDRIQYNANKPQEGDYCSCGGVIQVQL